MLFFFLPNSNVPYLSHYKARVKFALTLHNVKLHMHFSQYFELFAE